VDLNALCDAVRASADAHGDVALDLTHLTPIVSDGERLRQAP
jgi:hypothetical protein